MCKLKKNNHVNNLKESCPGKEMEIFLLSEDWEYESSYWQLKVKKYIISVYLPSVEFKLFQDERVSCWNWAD